MKTLLIIAAILIMTATAGAETDCIQSAEQISAANVHVGKGRLCGIWVEPLSPETLSIQIFDSKTQSGAQHLGSGAGDNSDTAGDIFGIYPTSGGAVKLTPKFVITTGTLITLDSIPYSSGLYIYIEYEKAYQRLYSVRYMLYYDPR